MHLFCSGERWKGGGYFLGNLVSIRCGKSQCCIPVENCFKTMSCFMLFLKKNQLMVLPLCIFCVSTLNTAGTHGYSFLWNCCFGVRTNLIEFYFVENGWRQRGINQFPMFFFSLRSDFGIVKRRHIGGGNFVEFLCSQSSAFFVMHFPLLPSLRSFFDAINLHLFLRSIWNSLQTVVIFISRNFCSPSNIDIIMPKISGLRYCIFSKSIV